MTSAAEPDAGAGRGTPERMLTQTNNFHGPVVAPQGTFGPAWDGKAREQPRTGRIAAGEVATLSDCFAPPAPLADARAALARDRVIVLTGDRGVGKRTSAIVLLHELAAWSLEVLSPALTLEGLARYDFKAGHGYLVEDWQLTGDATDYAWRILRQQVEQGQAYLVITAASAKAGRSVTVFPWERPPVARVLATYTRSRAASGKVGWLIKRIPRAHEMQLLAVLGRRLAAGEAITSPVWLPEGPVKLRWSPLERVAFMLLPVLLVAGGLAAVGLVWPGLGHAATAPGVSAQAAVASVQSPDRLAAQLLNTPFQTADMPAGAWAAPNKLVTDQSGIGTPGLDEDISISFANVAIYTQATTSYLVFDRKANATAALRQFPVLPAGYQETGQPFTVAGFADPVRCLSARQDGQQQFTWACAVLSANVISYTTVTGGSDGPALESELARDALTHLRKAAAAIPSPSALPPQPTSATPSASMLPDSRFPAALVPAGLTWTAPYFQVSPNPDPSGLVGEETLNQFALQVDGRPTYARIYYYVFDNSQDAHAYASSETPPPTSSGNPAEVTRKAFSLPTTVSAQQTDCQSYRDPATSTSWAVGKSFCNLQWGNVVLSGVLQTGATAANLEPINPDLSIPYTLVRAGALYLGQLDAS